MNIPKMARIFVAVLAAIILLCCIVFRHEIEDLDEIKVIFSQEGGFYQEPFYLTLTTPGDATIYYTLDGSAPDRDSLVYEEPIYIYDASQNENVYSMHDDVSAAFLQDYIDKYVPGTEPGYAIPDYKVDKCTVIRAAAYDLEGHRSEESVQCYFVDYQEKEGFDNVYTVCINADPEELFGYEDGIYVLGKTFDDYLVSDQWNIDKVMRQDSWENWAGNYSNGRRADAHITIFDDREEYVTAATGEISIKGNTSVAYNQKSLSLWLDGQGVDLFDDGVLNTDLCLEAGGQDSLVNIRDKMVYDLSADTSVVTRDYIPCVMFLNGEYWGYYYLAQRYDESYFENYYGIDDKDLVLFKNGSLKYGVTEDSYLYEDIEDFLASHDMSLEENYEEFCEMVDMDSFMEYWAIEIIINNLDWGDAVNNSLWRSRSEEEYEKWRWILFDTNNHSMELDTLEQGNAALERVKNNSFLLSKLYENPQFVTDFESTLRRLETENFSAENVTAYINQYKEEHLENLMLNAKRFYGEQRQEEILQELDNIQEYFIER